MRPAAERVVKRIADELRDGATNVDGSDGGPLPGERRYEPFED
jgi:hypothetical protein